MWTFYCMFTVFIIFLYTTYKFNNKFYIFVYIIRIYVNTLIGIIVVAFYFSINISFSSSFKWRSFGSFLLVCMNLTLQGCCFFSSQAPLLLPYFTVPITFNMLICYGCIIVDAGIYRYQRGSNIFSFSSLLPVFDSF